MDYMIGRQIGEIEEEREKASLSEKASLILSA
jgi:hypothetical protein